MDGGGPASPPTPLPPGGTWDTGAWREPQHQREPSSFTTQEVSPPGGHGDNTVTRIALCVGLRRRRFARRLTGGIGGGIGLRRRRRGAEVTFASVEAHRAVV